MTIDEAIKRYKSNAEYERNHGNLQGCLEFKQLAEWLSKYQKIEDIYYHQTGQALENSLRSVIEDGKID